MKKEYIVIIILSMLLVATNVMWIIYSFQGEEGGEEWTVVDDFGYIFLYDLGGSCGEKTTRVFEISGEEWLVLLNDWQVSLETW